jgi:MFS family permease
MAATIAGWLAKGERLEARDRTIRPGDIMVLVRRRNLFVSDLITALKQRKLVQWALAYVAAAFAFLQGADIVAQRFGWPEQTMRLVIIALSIGLLVTLVLAWYHGERGAQRVSGTELLILALLLAVGGGFLWHFASGSREPAACCS